MNKFLDFVSYEEYLEGSHWQETRAAALERCGTGCQLCGESGRILDVHHNCYENLGCEDTRDVIVLCERCHQAFHVGLEVLAGEMK